MIELRRRNNKVTDTPSYSRLPKGYQEVEYLESTSSTRQCIMIPITILETSSIELHIQYTSYNNTYQSNCWANGAQFTISSSGVWHTTNVYAKIGQKYINAIEIDDLGYWKFFIDGELKSSNTSNSNPYFMYLFAASEKWGDGNYHPDYPCNARIYYSKIILKNGTIIELIPCRRLSDNVKGMYDIVNDVFYTNAGTGEFLVGQDVHYNLPPEYQQVEYLESNNTNGTHQYIDLKLSCPNGFLIKTKFQKRLTSNDDSILVGSRESFSSERNFFYINPSRFATLGLGTELLASNFKISDYTTYELEASTLKGNSYIKIDGVTHLESQSTEDRSADSLFLFKNNYETISHEFYGRVGETQISNDATIFRHLIPCYRKADNVAGMYDIVEGKFHTNAGTGEFIVGPDVIG